MGVVKMKPHSLWEKLKRMVEQLEQGVDTPTVVPIDEPTPQIPPGEELAPGVWKRRSRRADTKGARDESRDV